MRGRTPPPMMMREREREREREHQSKRKMSLIPVADQLPKTLVQKTLLP
jgi:hypothetical protein